jgi:hypothetical protein
MKALSGGSSFIVGHSVCNGAASRSNSIFARGPSTGLQKQEAGFDALHGASPKPACNQNVGRAVPSLADQPEQLERAVAGQNYW